MSPTVTYLTPTPPPPEFPVLNTTEEDTFATQPTLQEEDEVLMVRVLTYANTANN